MSLLRPLSLYHIIEPYYAVLACWMMAHGWHHAAIVHCPEIRLRLQCSEFENIDQFDHSRGLGVWCTTTGSYEHILQYTVPPSHVDTLLRLFPSPLVLK